MPCLLHIDASARFAASFSRRGSAAFADAWRATYPSGEVITRDRAVRPVPFITEAWTEVDDFTVINGLSDLDEISNAVADPQQQASWAITRQLLEELYAADAIVIGTPMYNWSVPAPLKAWIDHITFPWVIWLGRRCSSSLLAVAATRPTRQQGRAITRSRTSATGSRPSASPHHVRAERIHACRRDGATRCVHRSARRDARHRAVSGG